MSSSDNVTLYYMLLTDSWTFYLTFCGILVSVITLLYSFVLGKKAELEIYAEQTKLGNNDPLIKKKQRIAVSCIEKLASINKWCALILSMSFISCITSWICIRFLHEKYYFCILFVIGVMTLLMVTGTISLIRRLYWQYKNDIKV